MLIAGNQSGMCREDMWQRTWWREITKGLDLTLDFQPCFYWGTQKEAEMLFQRKVRVAQGPSGDLALHGICSNWFSKWHWVYVPLGHWASHKLHSRAALCPSSGHTLTLVEVGDCRVSVFAAPSSADRWMVPPWGTNTWIWWHLTILSWPVLLLKKWLTAAIRSILSVQSDLALSQPERYTINHKTQ